jgi:hypothetical protein
LKASRDLSFGNGHKLLGMNALLFIIAPVANSSAVGNGLGVRDMKVMDRGVSFFVA